MKITAVIHALVAALWTAVEIVLFATNFAVVVRRLHDTGRTATLPVVSSTLAIAATVLFFSPRFYATTEVGMSVIGPILMSGGMLVTIGLLIASAIVGLIAAVFLLLPGDPEPNRYGPPPGDHEDPGDKLPSDAPREKRKDLHDLCTWLQDCADPQDRDVNLTMGGRPHRSITQPANQENGT